MKHAAPARTHHVRRWLFPLIAAPLLFAGVAAAYFIANTGTGSFTVGNAGFSVVLQPATGPSLAPGNNATQTIDFTVTNNTNSAITLNTETAAITTDQAGGVLDTTSGQYVDSCLAIWFSTTWGDGGVPLPRSMAPGSALTYGEIFIVMPANTSINQNACSGLTPAVSLTVT
jgi:hypothetical protein